MNVRFVWVGIVVGLFSLPLYGASRDAEWANVDIALAHGTPKTAIETLDAIIRAAIAEKAYPEAVKAIAEKLAVAGDEKPAARIAAFQAEIAKAPPEMKPMMEAILAHWYWTYFQENRWKFAQRTSMGSAAGNDIETWDLPRILGEIDRHFAAALADDARLKATPIGKYDALLVKGNVPDAYRPTLYDFLCADALQFYQAGEHGVTHAENEFEIEADGPIFGTAEEFLAWKPEPTEERSPKRKAVELYQALLSFHRSDQDRSAYDDADLARLRYGINVAVGDDKAERYRAALQRFIDTVGQQPIATRALAELARRYREAGDPATAHRLAQRGAEIAPVDAGAAMCTNLITQIEAPAVHVQAERVWNAPWPTVTVTYRNLTKLHFRAIPLKFDTYLKGRRWYGEGFNRDEFENLLLGEAALSWSRDLPPTTDFKDHTDTFSAPATLKPGFYLIVASANDRFSTVDNYVSGTTVWVSELALITRDDVAHGRTGGFVLNAVTGEPVNGATIRTWRRNRNGQFAPARTLHTDINGQFELPYQEGPVVVLAEMGAQAISTRNELNLSEAAPQERATVQTVFFTDRSIYRPGQTIYYKGVVMTRDPQAGAYGVEADRTIKVVFQDPNGREIAHADHRTNDYGSFHGVFTAPRDRLTGRMTISVVGGSGATSFSVEEYKRPKFQVELQRPAEAAKLGANVAVVGKATAYTSASIAGAKVKWRVERRVQLPPWCWWIFIPETKAIAHGTTTTDADGTFRLQFPATPDRGISPKNAPVFSFVIYADVTDSTGETRSDERTVRAGYTAMEAAIEADSWQTANKPVEVRIATTSLDGNPQAATGTLLVSALEQPIKVERASLELTGYRWMFENDEPTPHPSKPESWKSGAAIARASFTTGTDGKAQVPITLPPGIYRASLETTDRSGQKVTAREIIEVLDPQDPRYRVKLPHRFVAQKVSVEPGETFRAVWATGYETGRAFVEIECNGTLLRRFWTAPDRTQSLLEQRVEEQMRGGFTVRVTYVRKNRAYLDELRVDVPWTNKQLNVKWESFRSKLSPGQKETWTATIDAPDAKRTAAEMVATLYDASLDQYRSHTWPSRFSVFRSEWSQVRSQLEDGLSSLQPVFGWSPPTQFQATWEYRALPPNVILRPYSDEVITLSPFSVDTTLRGSRMARRPAPALTMAAPAAQSPERIELADMASGVTVGGALSPTAIADEPPDATAIDLNKVVARKNLNETAFFFPTLLANEDGRVKIVFTVPEALTQWKFMGFAHDRELRSGLLTDTAVTAKPLMVEPNAPRFVREGDVIELTVKVTNQTDELQSGAVRLTFADAESEANVDAALQNRAPEQPVKLAPKESRSFSWRIAVPDAIGFLTYKAVAATAKQSDGEEGALPVLSRRVLVTESLPLPIRGPAARQFDFKKLEESGSSPTLRQESLTVQMVSQPAWYAVMALPYLMEYPYECSEQVFNRYYANVLAQHIAQTNPKIRRIFDQWKNTPALDSPLEKNESLKSVALEETPWVRQAKKESEARRNVGLLFDRNHVESEAARALQTLADRQTSGGLWTWFPGGPPCEYISLYIAAGFGRLRQAGVGVDAQPAIKCLAALDSWTTNHYTHLQREPHPEDYVPSSLDAFYLYGRSFFLKDRAIDSVDRPAVDFLLGQARKYWLKVGSWQSQAHLAIALQRFGDADTARAIMRSLKERSQNDPELGMFWSTAEEGWWWYHAPIETQSVMIEAFAEVANDAQAVEDCKVWLLKQKQTQAWPTTKSTADAVYALLLRGSNLLASDARVEVTLGHTPIKPEKVEAGTGFYEQRFAGDAVKPEMGRVTVKKTDEGVSWGSVHWQYLEDMAKVTPHTGTPLKLTKALFVKETTSQGRVLRPVTGPVSVGDELVVRLELRTDRDMEFVHLKDYRGSGTEPATVLSGYKHQDSLWYYESTRDTATHFFIDYLPKGTYVFEYSTRVQLRGQYQTGFAEIQCMYAPEFNSHSESIPIAVK